MALLMGGTFAPAVVADEVYDPVYDTPVDANFIYQLLPSFYRTVMQDQEVFSTLWSAAMQSTFADLLNLWQVDFAKSLKDVPVLSQRKWVEVSLYKTEDFELEPGLTSVGTQPLRYSKAGQRLEGDLVNRSRWDKTFFPMAASVNERTSLAWGVDLEISSVEPYSAALFGYFPSDAQRISNTLAFAVLGDGPSGNPVAAILHFDPSGIVTVSIDSYTLKREKAYRLEATFTSGTGAIVLSVTELRRGKIFSPSGYVRNDLSAGLSNIFRDDSVNFDAAGVASGDTLLAFGSEYEVLSVDGSTLTVSPIGLPADVDGVSYSIEGPVEVSSLSMDLPGDAPDPSFSADLFGVCSLDTRGVSPLLFSPPSSARRKKLSFSTTNWRWLDPSVPETLLSVPRLQERVTDPQELQYEGTDYVVEREPYTPTDPPASVFRFQEPPRETLWAEYAAYDEQYIRNNFGLSVGLDDVSSSQYKARVRGLYYAYFRGPTVEATRTGVHILVGLPIAEEDGVVESINPSYSGKMGLLTVSGKDYLYPLAVGTDLKVGDPVRQFQPLSLGVEVVDYRIDPEWFVRSQKVSELQKFHTFQVRLNLDAFDVGTLSLAGAFVNQIKPTWKRAVFQAFKGLWDEVDVSDALVAAFSLNLYDPICDNPIPAYDESIFGWDQADWRYDQGVDDWTLASSAMRKTSTEMPGHASLTVSSTTLTGQGTLFTSEVGPAGPQTGKYLLVSTRYSGSSGQSVAGQNTFLDNTPNVFDSVQPLDEFFVDGEGSFLVLSVDWNLIAPQSLGEFTSPTSLVDLSASFLSAGVQPGDVVFVLAGVNAGSEYEISAVVSQTEVTVAGATGSGGAPSDVYEIRRLNQVTLDSPLGFSDTEVSWSSKGKDPVWAEVASVTSDTSLELAVASPRSGSAFLGILNNRYKEVYYDQFSEVCPDERFTLVLEYTNGSAPGVTTVPGAPFQSQTTFNFASVGDTYTVTLDERGS